MGLTHCYKMEGFLYLQFAMTGCHYVSSGCYCLLATVYYR